MKNIKNYNSFLNEEINLNKLNPFKKKEIKEEEPIKIYEDDDIFDTLFKEIKESFNYDNLENRLTYKHNGDKIEIVNNGMSMRSKIWVLKINNTELDVNPKKVEELHNFFSNEYKVNSDKKYDLSKSNMKKEFTGKDNISDNELSDIVFDKLNNIDLKDIKWGEVKNQGYGYITQLNKYTIGVVNNTSERSREHIYPTNNLFIDDIGFMMDIHHMKKLWNFLKEKAVELENNKKKFDRKSIRDKYIK